MQLKKTKKKVEKLLKYNLKEVMNKIFNQNTG